MTTSVFIRAALPAAFALALVACSDSDSDTPPPVAPVAGSSTGVLTDGPVGGVSFQTSSGVTGVTNAAGQYRFNAGDTVTFSLGTLTLGTVPANGVITPIDLANGSANRLTNLLILLQSLDIDGDPANNISIPSAAAAAVTASIDLTSNPVDFASASTNPILAAAMTAAGITTPLRSVADAEAHFLSQAMPLLAGHVWFIQGENSVAVARILADGSYLMGEAAPDDYMGLDCVQVGNDYQCSDAQSVTPVTTAGVEAGTLTATTFDTHGYVLQATTTLDTNSEAGFSHPLICDRIKPEGDRLIAGAACDDAATLGKAPNVANGLVGLWAMGSASALDTQHFLFLANGHYLMVDPIGDEDRPEDNHVSCGGPGVEYNGYTLTAQGSNTYQFVPSTQPAYDTNGCAGLHSSGEPANTLTMTINGDTLSVSGSDDGGPFSFTLYRVSH